MASASEDTQSKDILFNSLDMRNIERSPEFVFNSRGDKLHVRSFWPSDKPKAVVIFLHGYSAHISRPHHLPIANQLNENGYAYICLDFHGHGYSEGLRGYVQDFTHLEDDVISLLFHLYRKKDTDGQNVKYDADVCYLHRRAYGCSFYLMGSSQGGSIALRLGNRLYNNPTFPFSAHFRGCILLSPLIRTHTPSTFRRVLVDYTMVPLFPKSFMSSTRNRDPIRDLTFSNPDYLQYVKSDEYPENPEGLSYAGPLYYKTASETLRMMLSMNSAIEQVSFPFIVFHDDKDEISLVDGIKELMRKSRTSQNHKEYKQVNGGRHEVIANKMNDVLPGILEWLKSESS